VGQTEDILTTFVQPLAEHWNGSSWTVVPTPSIDSSSAIAYSVSSLPSSEAWMVGTFSDPDLGNAEQPLTEHWDGSDWTAIYPPAGSPVASGLIGVAAVSPNDVWAVGHLQVPGGPVHTLAEHWDGTSWSLSAPVNPSPAGEQLFALSAVSSSDVWAVGYVATPTKGISETLAEHWNGTDWTQVPTLNPGRSKHGASFLGVWAESANDVWAVGAYGTGRRGDPPVTHPLVEHWDGNA
jgi:hypothetical protein